MDLEQHLQQPKKELTRRQKETLMKQKNMELLTDKLQEDDTFLMSQYFLKAQRVKSELVQKKKMMQP